MLDHSKACWSTKKLCHGTSSHRMTIYPCYVREEKESGLLCKQATTPMCQAMELLAWLSICHATYVFVYAAYPRACRPPHCTPTLCAMLATQLHLEPGQEPQQLDAATSYSPDHMRGKTGLPQATNCGGGARVPSPSPAAGPPAAAATHTTPKASPPGPGKQCGQPQGATPRPCITESCDRAPRRHPCPFSPAPSCSLPERTNMTLSSALTSRRLLFHQASRFHAAAKLVWKPEQQPAGMHHCLGCAAVHIPVFEVGAFVWK